MISAPKKIEFEGNEHDKYASEADFFDVFIHTIPPVWADPFEVHNWIASWYRGVPTVYGEPNQWGNRDVHPKPESCKLEVDDFYFDGGDIRRLTQGAIESYLRDAYRVSAFDAKVIAHDIERAKRIEMDKAVDGLVKSEERPIDDEPWGPDDSETVPNVPGVFWADLTGRRKPHFTPVAEHPCPSCGPCGPKKAKTPDLQQLPKKAKKDQAPPPAATPKRTTRKRKAKDMSSS